MQFLLHPAALGRLFLGLCGTESVLAALPIREDAPGTSQGVWGRNALLCPSQKAVAGKRELRAPLFGRANKTSAAPWGLPGKRTAHRSSGSCGSSPWMLPKNRAEMWLFKIQPCGKQGNWAHSHESFAYFSVVVCKLLKLELFILGSIANKLKKTFCCCTGPAWCRFQGLLACFQAFFQ